MKQIISAAILIATCSMSINATGQDLQIEVIGGPALTSLYGSSLVRSIYKTSINFSAGAGVSYRVLGKSYLNARLLFDKKGAKGDLLITVDNNEKYSYIIRENYSYITLPIQWQQEFGTKIRFRAGAGVYGAYLVHENSKLDAQGDYSGQGMKNHEEFNGTSQYNRADFGISASAGTYIPLSQSLQFLIGINDNLGLLKINKQPGVLAPKHNSLALTTGVSFKL